VTIVAKIKASQKQSLLLSLSHKACRLSFVIILFMFLLNYSNRALAQDTVKNIALPLNTIQKPPHSPKKATLYALVLPGLGQAYNHKYWKIPIVYAGFATCIYFIVDFTKYYNEVKDAYNYVSITAKTNYPATPINYFHPKPLPPNAYATAHTENELREGLDGARRNVELTYISTGVWYLLTVVDATVDAHFFDYDINNDLTLKIKPWVPVLGTHTASSGFTGGINLTLKF